MFIELIDTPRPRAAATATDVTCFTRTDSDTGLTFAWTGRLSDPIEVEVDNGTTLLAHVIVDAGDLHRIVADVHTPGQPTTPAGWAAWFTTVCGIAKRQLRSHL